MLRRFSKRLNQLNTLSNDESKSLLPTHDNATTSENANLVKAKLDNKEINEMTSQTISIKSFREFVDLFYKKREGVLHAHLYNSAKLILFKEGEITLNTEDISDTNFTRIVSRYISKWTGRIWTISNSNSNIGNTLLEEDIIKQKEEIEIMKKDQDVKEIMNKFSGISIHSITSIKETSEEEMKELKKRKN